MNSITKKCRVCGVVKNIDEYYKNKFGWVSYRCKTCTKKSVKKWAKNNPDKRKEIANKYAKKNKHKQDAWRDQHKDSVNKSKREYYQRNKDGVRQAIKNWFSRNNGKTQEYKRNRRARILNAKGTITDKEWKELCDRYGNRCLSCGATNVKLTLDHVVPLSSGGAHTIENAQPLCLPCNLSKARKTIDYR